MAIYLAFVVYLYRITDYYTFMNSVEIYQLGLDGGHRDGVSNG